MQPEDLTPEKALDMLQYPNHPAVRAAAHAVVVAEFERLRALPQRPDRTED